MGSRLHKSPLNVAAGRLKQKQVNSPQQRGGHSLPLMRGEEKCRKWTDRGKRKVEESPLFFSRAGGENVDLLTRRTTAAIKASRDPNNRSEGPEG